MFTANDVQARILQKPFVPVRIITSSGQAYDVTHPDLVLVGRRDLVIGVASNDNPAQYDSLNRVSILHITDMQDLPVSAPPTGDANGQPT